MGSMTGFNKARRRSLKEGVSSSAITQTFSGTVTHHVHYSGARPRDAAIGSTVNVGHPLI